MKSFLVWNIYFTFSWFITLFHIRITSWKCGYWNVENLTCGKSFWNIAGFITPTWIRMYSVRYLWIKIFRRTFLPKTTFKVMEKRTPRRFFKTNTNNICLNSLCLFQFFNDHIFTLSFSLLFLFIRSLLTCQSRFDMFKIWIWKTWLANVPRTFLQRPII